MPKPVGSHSLQPIVAFLHPVPTLFDVRHHMDPFKVFPEQEEEDPKVVVTRKINSASRNMRRRV